MEKKYIDEVKLSSEPTESSPGSEWPLGPRQPVPVTLGPATWGPQPCRLIRPAPQGPVSQDHTGRAGSQPCTRNQGLLHGPAPPDPLHITGVRGLSHRRRLLPREPGKAFLAGATHVEADADYRNLSLTVSP
ncbi:hypothetical protein AAFF_G00359200 [Aldrovandia affinis]|uniref:Uncharacterized protein n=1 Tax=Aldrovandia affinis TaxID=143900 RepID=A0AAD7WNZ0_9TELE|nr:hypothetical protein AAFF_G00359200 [Aldrovandia affinis]